MLHFDLDDVLPLAPFAAELDEVVSGALATCLALPAPPAIEEKPQQTLSRGRQRILLRERVYRAVKGEQALVVRLDYSRFVCPAAARVDQTLEVFVLPESGRVGRARLLIGLGAPLVGLLIGFLGWRLLQYDTNMSPLAWTIAGALLGLAPGIYLNWRFAHHVGVWLEDRLAWGSWANRRRVEETLSRAIADKIARHAETAATATIGEPALIETDPVWLARFAAELMTDPDAAVSRHGLRYEMNRDRIARAFTEMENSSEQYAVYVESIRADSAVKQ